VHAHTMNKIPRYTLWRMISHRIYWLHKKRCVFVQLEFLECVAASTYVVHAHPPRLCLWNMRRLDAIRIRRSSLRFWLGLCRQWRWRHTTSTRSDGSSSRLRRSSNLGRTGHELELGGSRRCRYKRAPRRRATRFEGPRHLGSCFDQWKLWGLFSHRSRRKVDSDFRWGLFDTSENHVG
jgi:hypothetical protein